MKQNTKVSYNSSLYLFLSEAVFIYNHPSFNNIFQKILKIHMQLVTDSRELATLNSMRVMVAAPMLYVFAVYN